MITEEELKQAQITIFKWFLEQRQDKPVTLLDSMIETDEAKFRLITHLSFQYDDKGVTDEKHSNIS